MMKQTSTIQIRFKSFIKYLNIISVKKQITQNRKRKIPPEELPLFLAGKSK